MGEVTVSGSGAEAFLNHVLTGDIRKLAVEQGQYTLMCNERGEVIDDLYALPACEPGDIFDYQCIRRIDADVAWLEKQLAAFLRRNEVELKRIFRMKWLQ